MTFVVLDVVGDRVAEEAVGLGREPAATVELHAAHAPGSGASQLSESAALQGSQMSRIVHGPALVVPVTEHTGRP